MKNIHPDARIRQLRHDVRQFLLHWPLPQWASPQRGPIETGGRSRQVPLTIRFLVEPYRMTSSHLSALAKLMISQTLNASAKPDPPAVFARHRLHKGLHETVMNPTTNRVLTPSEDLRNVLDLVNFSGSTKLRRRIREPFHSYSSSLAGIF